MSTRPTQTPGPLVSVIVPTYNYARFIGQTLENLRAQTYESWECVVVDDGSRRCGREGLRLRADRRQRAGHGSIQGLLGERRTVPDDDLDR